MSSVYITLIVWLNLLSNVLGYESASGSVEDTAKALVDRYATSIHVHDIVSGLYISTDQPWCDHSAWRTKHFFGYGCKPQALCRPTRNGIIQACTGKTTKARVSTVQETWKTVSSLKLTLGLDDILGKLFPSYVFEKSSLELSQSFEYTSQVMNSESTTTEFDKGYKYMEMSCTLVFECATAYSVDDTTRFVSSGATEYSQGVGSWSLEEEDDAECMKQGLEIIAIDSCWTQRKKARKCTHPKYGVLTQKEGDGTKWWGLSGATWDNRDNIRTLPGGATIPMTTDGYGISYLDYELLPCSSYYSNDNLQYFEQVCGYEGNVFQCSERKEGGFNEYFENANTHDEL